MTSFLSLQIHGGADHDGGIAGGLAELLAYFDNISGLSAGELFALFLPGVAALDNIHPMLVHYPIAFLTVFFALDTVGSLANKPQWRHVASWLLYFGAFSAIFTVITGLIAASSVAHGGDVHAIMERHQQFGLFVLGLALVLAAWRAKTGPLPSGGANHFFLIIAALMCGLLMLGADLGGLMVYRHGVAVKAVPTGEEAHQHQHGQTP